MSKGASDATRCHRFADVATRDGVVVAGACVVFSLVFGNTMGGGMFWPLVFVAAVGARLVFHWPLAIARSPGIPVGVRVARVVSRSLSIVTIIAFVFSEVLCPQTPVNHFWAWSAIIAFVWRYACRRSYMAHLKLDMLQADDGQPTFPEYWDEQIVTLSRGRAVPMERFPRWARGDGRKRDGCEHRSETK